MTRMQIVLLVVTLVVLGAAPLLAQACRGSAANSPGWFALNVGPASERAVMHGAEISWQFDQGTFVFADAQVTSYPRSDLPRRRVAAGVGFVVAESARFGICTTMGAERERIGGLHVKRIPVGLSMGWARPLPGRARGIGFTVEPFVVHQDERIERFAHTSNFLSGRTGMLYVTRGWLTGLTYEHAFDADARWHATARVGFTFN
jgi:hypothetical protein